MRLVLLVAFAVVAALGCGKVIEPSPVEVEPKAEDAPPDAGARESRSPEEAGGADGSPAAPRTYSEAAPALASLRYAGPVTNEGSVGVCTPNYFVWRDQDGAMHSWSANTKARIDYGFTSKPRSFFAASDTVVVGDAAQDGGRTLGAYATGAPLTLLRSFAEPSGGCAATSTGLLFGTRYQASIELSAGAVESWVAATDHVERVAGFGESVPYAPPHSSFAYDRLALSWLPQGSPGRIYVVDVPNNAFVRFAFDGVSALYGTKPSPEGLLVAYARADGTPGVRLYRAPASPPYELGEDLANRPPVYPDSPETEHALRTHVEYWKGKVLTDSPHGIFAYDLTSSKLSAVQLGLDGTPFFADLLCVMEGANLLAYRLEGDPTGQVWIVPLGSVFP